MHAEALAGASPRLVFLAAGKQDAAVISAAISNNCFRPKRLDLRPLTGLLSLYQPLDDLAYQQLTADVIGLYDAHGCPWGVRFEWSSVIAALPDAPRGLGQILGEMLKRAGAARRADTVVYVEEDLALAPRDALIVDLVRDPRTLVCDAQKGMREAELIAHGLLWAKRREQVAALRAGGASRVLTLKVEDLIAAPQTGLGRLGAFMGVVLSSSFSLPAIAALNERDAALVEAAAGSWLAAAGYINRAKLPLKPGLVATAYELVEAAPYERWAE